MTTVFISHGRKIAASVDSLKKSLLLQGITVVDDSDFILSSDLSSSIVSAIKSADLVIIVGDDFDTNVMYEAGIATGSGKPLVVLRTRRATVPMSLASRPSILTEELDDTTVGQLLRDLKPSRSEEELLEDDIAYNSFSSNAMSITSLLAPLTVRPDLVDTVSPENFERFVHSYFLELGFEVSVVKHPNAGYDFWIQADNEKLAIVDAKKLGLHSKLSIQDVHRLIGVAMVERIPAAIMVTSGSYTKPAIDLAHHSEVPIVLLTLRQLLEETKSGITKRCTQVADRPFADG